MTRRSTDAMQPPQQPRSRRCLSQVHGLWAIQQCCAGSSRRRRPSCRCQTSVRLTHCALPETLVLFTFLSHQPHPVAFHPNHYSALRLLPYADWWKKIPWLWQYRMAQKVQCAECLNDLLGPFHGAIAVPSVTRCRCRRRRVVVVDIARRLRYSYSWRATSDTWWLTM